MDDDDDDSMSDNNLHWVSVTAKLDYHKIYSCTRWRRPYKTHTVKPHRPYIYKDTWMWFISYPYTTRSKTYKPTTTTTRRTKRRKGQNASLSTAYWWNKWWYFQTGGSATLDKDWWKIDKRYLSRKTTTFDIGLT